MAVVPGKGRLGAKAIMESWRNRIALWWVVGGAVALGVVYWSVNQLAGQLEPISPAARDAALTTLNHTLLLLGGVLVVAGYLGFSAAAQVVDASRARGRNAAGQDLGR